MSVNQPNHKGWTALHMAALSDNAKNLRMLLAKGAKDSKALGVDPNDSYSSKSAKEIVEQRGIEEVLYTYPTPTHTIHVALSFHIGNQGNAIRRPVLLQGQVPGSANTIGFTSASSARRAASWCAISSPFDT